MEYKHGKVLQSPMVFLTLTVITKDTWILTFRIYRKTIHVSRQ